MKKLIALLLALVFVLALVGCGKSNEGDYPATIMVNGTNYYSTDNAIPVEVDESVIQYTTSYAENGIPQKDGEANFNRDLGTSIPAWGSLRRTWEKITWIPSGRQWKNVKNWG